ncbi:MAG TPA: CapA family protein [Candidatus Blautia faecigallinarum]|uniref:CapA family protein n=1 Tax=Candidatus Blautia faecigallinarum TaxID=2838488 RepID=A0A9D2DV44_9FIRM|nr:CapA family protein [Candidatus Blautia faecigallinarum]
MPSPKDKQRHTTSKTTSPVQSRGRTRSRTGTPSPNRRSRTRYKRSRYYRRRRQRFFLIAGAAAFLLLLVLIFSIRGCVKSHSGKEENAVLEAAETDGTLVSMSSAEEEALKEKAAEPVSLTVSVVGDCTLGTDVSFNYSTSLNAYYDVNGKDYFFQNVRDIFQKDDLTIANMEGTLTTLETREAKQFAFKAPPEYAGILSSGSVEAVNMANNHSKDYGEQSYTDTLAALDQEGIVHFGYDETAVMDIKGVKVGLVGIYELNDHLGREQQLKDNIAKVKEEGAQLVIVIFHWGNEKQEVPDSNQTTLGRLAIDEGADLVCGHHPHVLQGIETYKGKNIVYSLGNFCFGGNSAPSDTDSMIFQQTFTIGENGVQADNVTNIIPCSISSAYGYNNYQPTPAEGTEADRILQKIEERSSYIQPASEASETAEAAGAISQ